MPLVKDPLLPIVLGRHHGDRLLRCLTDTGTRFVVVGGCAVAAWGKRPFGEVDGLDLLTEPSASNAQALEAGVLAVGLPAAVSMQALGRDGQQLRLNEAGFKVQLITPGPQLSFAEAYDEALRCAQFGVELRIASLATLIKMKRQVIAALRTSLDKHDRDLRALLGS